MHGFLRRSVPLRAYYRDSLTGCERFLLRDYNLWLNDSSSRRGWPRRISLDSLYFSTDNKFLIVIGVRRNEILRDSWGEKMRVPFLIPYLKCYPFFSNRKWVPRRTFCYRFKPGYPILREILRENSNSFKQPVLIIVHLFDTVSVSNQLEVLIFLL